MNKKEKKGRFDAFKEKLLKIAPDGDLKGVNLSGFHFYDVKLWESFLEEFGTPPNLRYHDSISPFWAGDLIWQGMRISVFAPYGWSPKGALTAARVSSNPLPSTPHSGAVDAMPATPQRKPLWERPEDIPKCKLPCPSCGGVMQATIDLSTQKIIIDMWDCRRCLIRYNFTKEEEEHPELLVPYDGINRASLLDLK